MSYEKEKRGDGNGGPLVSFWCRRRHVSRSSSSGREKELKVLNATIVACRKCPRLVKHREKIARVKRRAFRDWDYWGKPVTGFGDPNVRHGGLLIVGLAPAAHGGNRTGRVFTGDRSGNFLFERLYEAGFANQPASQHLQDGLRLRRAYITATVRCAPPGNKPLPQEQANCRPYLEAELALLRPRAVLALGRIAFDAYLKLLLDRGAIPARRPYEFRHGASYQLPGGLPRLFAVYHPSQQNTLTGKLTPPMYRKVLKQIQRFLRET